MMLQPWGQTLLSCYKITANIKFLLKPTFRLTYPFFNHWKLLSSQHFERRQFRLKWENLTFKYWTSENFILKQKGSSVFWKWIKQRFMCLPFCATTIMDLSQMVISSNMWNDSQPDWFSKKSISVCSILPSSYRKGFVLILSMTKHSLEQDKKWKLWLEFQIWSSPKMIDALKPASQPST